MASSAEIVHALPDTLPEDFSEWDGGLPTATQQPVNSKPSNSAAGDRAAAKPSSHAANPPYNVLAVLDGATDIPRFTATGFYASEDAVLRSFRSNDANRRGLKQSVEKRITMAIVSIAAILLLLLLISRLHPGLVAANHSIAKLSAATEKSTATDAIEASPSQVVTGAAKSSTKALKPVPSTQPAAETAKEADPPQVQSKMMTDQLSAPKQIPHDIENVAQTEAPPSPGFAGVAMDGLGTSGNNLAGNVFGSGNNRLKVKAEPPTKVNISSGLAAGMLVRKTTPQYPEIAKLAHVSGTVVLQTTISKTGMIENLRVISGPPMLRQSAMDAVKTWRYRPYLLSGDPVEVESTVSVVFAP